MVGSKRRLAPSAVLTVFSLALLACDLLFISSASALTIDEFDGSQTVSANPTSPSNFSGAPGSGVVGGIRKLRINWLSGANAPSLDTDVTIVRQGEEGSLVYSQDATVAAQCLVSWDGTISANPATNLGSGGIDLRQDGGTAFALEILGNDLATQLELTVTDATDASRTSKAVSNIDAGGARTIFIPFSSLTGNANLSTIGAISLLINKGGTQALDLSLAYIGTNGQCRAVPNSSGRVLDECGVCGGDNSSCTDCMGIINGAAVLDRCNVCNGDGNSCLSCTQRDITLILSTMDASAKTQEALLRNIYNKIGRSTRSRSVRRTIAAGRKQAHALQIRNWTLSWTIPRISTSCTNTTFCTSVSNRAFIEEYRRNSESLRQMTIDALKLWQRVNRAARRHVPNYLRQASRTHAYNERLLADVPRTQTACT